MCTTSSSSSIFKKNISSTSAKLTMKHIDTTWCYKQNAYEHTLQRRIIWKASKPN